LVALILWLEHEISGTSSDLPIQSIWQSELGPPKAQSLTDRLYRSHYDHATKAWNRLSVTMEWTQEQAPPVSEGGKRGSKRTGCRGLRHPSDFAGISRFLRHDDWQSAGRICSTFNTLARRRRAMVAPRTPPAHPRTSPSAPRRRDPVSDLSGLEAVPLDLPTISIRPYIARCSESSRSFKVQMLYLIPGTLRITPYRPVHSASIHPFRFLMAGLEPSDDSTVDFLRRNPPRASRHTV
jgi:hypothetical protein